jgi:hypothetical protein
MSSSPRRWHQESAVQANMLVFVVASSSSVADKDVAVGGSWDRRRLGERVARETWRLDEGALAVLVAVVEVQWASSILSLSLSVAAAAKAER